MARMRISFCCTDTPAQPWLAGLRAALPQAEVMEWKPGAAGADHAVVWAPSQQFLDEQPGLRGIHDFRTRRSGTHDFAQFHMEVDPRISVAAAHDLVEGVEANLKRAFPKVEVLIHLDPEGHVDTDNPLVEADVTPHWFGKRV